MESFRQFLYFRALNSALISVEHLEDFLCSEETHADSPGDRGLIPGRVILLTQKIVLDSSLVNT